jgi:hypothetical protein
VSQAKGNTLDAGMRDSLVTLVTSEATASALDEFVVTTGIISPLPSTFAVVQQATVAPSTTETESAAGTSAAPGSAKSSDAGSALSLVAQAVNRAPTATSTSGTVKATTNALDEMYRTMTAVSAASAMGGYNPDSGDDEMPEDYMGFWNLDMLLTDVDSETDSKEQVIE